jgi:hypothetical protein
MSDNVEVRAKFLLLLMERIRQDRHPSSTHMAILEQALPPEWIPDYLEILFEKIEDDPHPSIPMISRIARLVESAP